MPMSKVARETLAGMESRPIKRLLIPIVIVALGFCIVCAWALLESRRAIWPRAADSATSLVATMERDIARNIETIDLSLNAVADNLKHSEIQQISPELRHLVLFDRSATARYLGAILVTDEEGRVRLDSRTFTPSQRNLADRDYFQIHRSDPSAGTYISQPLITRGTQRPAIVISQRLSNFDGSFAGIVLASLDLEYFVDLFKNASLGPNGNITLARMDGIVLARWPYKQEYLGLDISHAKIYTQFIQADTGHFETYSATDGVHRLVAYSKVGRLPLIIGVGQSVSEIFATWYRFAAVIASIISILCAMTAALAFYLVRELGRRQKVETKLAELALKDGLTDLANRRCFQIVLEREWSRAAEAGNSVSLIMIDADRFKYYNDSHGHQAGDRLLKAIARSIVDGGSRDQSAARYGGDEFAVLLPSSNEDAASEIAARIRSVFERTCQRELIEGAGLSIGIASRVPAKGGTNMDLVCGADRALYRAKFSGRHRTEIDRPAAFVECAA